MPFYILMKIEDLSLPLVLRRFVKLYLKEALDLAKKEFSPEEFYDRLIKSVSEKSGYPEKIILGLHHPFHWELFSKNGSSFLEYVQPVEKGERRYIKLKRNYSEEDIDDFSNSFLRKWETTLLGKLERL